MASPKFPHRTFTGRVTAKPRFSLLLHLILFCSYFPFKMGLITFGGWLSCIQSIQTDAGDMHLRSFSPKTQCRCLMNLKCFETHFSRLSSLAPSSLFLTALLYSISVYYWSSIDDKAPIRTILKRHEYLCLGLSPKVHIPIVSILLPLLEKQPSFRVVSVSHGISCWEKSILILSDSILSSKRMNPLSSSRVGLMRKPNPVSLPSPCSP